MVLLFKVFVKLSILISVYKYKNYVQSHFYSIQKVDIVKPHVRVMFIFSFLIMPTVSFPQSLHSVTDGR